ncbi:MAG TPA: hypothetical protein VF974_04435 [Patescibacteria group bacterium]
MRQFVRAVLVVALFPLGFGVGYMRGRIVEQKNVSSITPLPQKISCAQIWRFERAGVSANWSVKNSSSPDSEAIADELILAFIMTIGAGLATGPEVAPFLLGSLADDMAATTQKHLDLLKELKEELLKSPNPRHARPKDIRRLSD